MWKKLLLLFMLNILVFITPSYAVTYLKQGATTEFTVDQEVGVIWTSSDPNIAYVNQDGKVFARKTKGGSVTITATDIYGQTLKTETVFVWNAKMKKGQFYTYDSDGNEGTIAHSVMYLYLQKSGNYYKILARSGNNEAVVGRYFSNYGVTSEHYSDYWEKSDYFDASGVVEDKIIEALKEIEWSEELADNLLEDSVQSLTAKFVFNADKSKFYLEGKARITKNLVESEESSGEGKVWEVEYYDENGGIKTAYKSSDDSSWYDSDSGEIVNIVFYVDLDNSGAIGYRAVGEPLELQNIESDEEYVEKIHPVKILFPGNIIYNNEKIKEINITEKEMQGEGASWKTLEIEMPEIFGMFYEADTGRYYVPIVVSSYDQEIICKYYIDFSKGQVINIDEPIAYKWNAGLNNQYMYYMRDYLEAGVNTPVVGEKLNSFNVIMPSDYSEEKEYRAGDILSIRGTACKHSLNSVKTELKEETVTEKGKWIKYKSYWKGSTIYGVKYYATRPANSETKKTVKFDHNCSNGYKQYKVTCYYREIINKTIYTEEKTQMDHVGELSCPVDISFKGFRVNGNVKNIHAKEGRVYLKYDGGEEIELDNETARRYLKLVSEFTQGEDSNWGTTIKIDDLSQNREAIGERNYDENRGLWYGTITVTCDNQTQTFKLYFAPTPGNQVTYTITYIADPVIGGVVPSNKKYTEAQVKNEDYYALENDGWKFNGWEFKYYDKVHKDPILIRTDMPKSGNFTFPSTMVDGKVATDIVATAKFAEIDKYSIRYVANPLDGGTVPSNEYGIMVGNTKTIKDTDAIANPGYTFTGWVITNDTTGATITRDENGNFTMPTSNVTATANFSNGGVYTITYVASPIEGGRVPASESEIESGTSKQITENMAQANPGYTFDGWTITNSTAGEIIKTGKNVEFTMPASNVIATANFSNGSAYTITYVASPIEGGTVPSNAYGIEAGTSKQITENMAQANPGYTFDGWTITNSTTGGIIKTGKNVEFIMPGANLTATANFSDKKQIQVIIIGKGTVTANGTAISSDEYIVVKKGDEIKFEATPATDWMFGKYYSDIDNNLSENTSYTHEVGDETIIYVEFNQPDKYSITYVASPIEGGTVPSNAYGIEAGTSKQITENMVQANLGYTFDVWEIKNSTTGEIIKTGKNVEFTMPKANVIATAKFPIDTYTITYVASPIGGGIVPASESEIEIGTSKKITENMAQANPGYTFDVWEIKNSTTGKIIEIGKNVEFSMPPSNVTATAIFEGDKKITIKIIGDGEVTADGIKIPDGGIVTGKTGDEIKFVADPNTDWVFEGWVTEDGVELNPEYIYTIEDDETIIAVFKKKGPYTLYVTSLYGGKAEITNILKITGDVKYTMANIERTVDDLGQIVYKLTNVYAGDRFELQYLLDKENYEFAFWEYKPYINADLEVGNKLEITMPTSDLTVTAVFKNDNITDTPELSVTTNNPEWGEAYTIIEGDRTVTDKKYNNVVIGENYTIYYDAKPGYYFVNWNYSTTETPFISEDVIKMPNKDLEVMAMFAPIPPKGDGGHKITFKAEPPEGGKVPDDSDMENILPGGKVTIAVTTNIGWEFLYWRFENSNGESVSPYVEFGKIPGTGYFIMPDYDIVAIAVFRKLEPNSKYTLTVSANPEDGGTVKIVNNNDTVLAEIVPGTECKVTTTANKDYKFKYWYIIKDGEEVRLSYDAEYEFTMPGDNRNLIAKFEYNGPGPGPRPDPEELYNLSVSVDPSNAGTARIQGYASTSIELCKGTSYTAIVTASGSTVEIGGIKYEYTFDGWYDNDTKVSSNLTYRSTMPSRDVNLVAVFNATPIDDHDNNVISSDAFRIVSVRDLNWKNYFVNSKGQLTGNYFAIPDDKTNMLHNVSYEGKYYEQTIKMGYAVEFELDTISVPYENAYLVITPTLVNNSGTKVDNSNIYDGNSKIASYFLSPITIYANKSDKNSNNAYSKFMADAIPNPNVYNVGENQNFITWRWVYYLPAETDITKFNNNTVTVRFSIALYESVSNEKLWDVVQYYNIKGKKWQGDVFEYSLKESLLDDIYNNAQN